MAKPPPVLCFTTPALQERYRAVCATESRRLHLFFNALVHCQPRWLEDGGYFPCSRERLGDFLDRNHHKQCRETLRDMGVISYRGFEKGKHSREYHIREPIDPVLVHDPRLRTQLIKAIHRMRASGKSSLTGKRKPLGDIVLSPKLSLNPFAVPDALRERLRGKFQGHSLEWAVYDRLWRTCLFAVPQMRYVSQGKCGRLFTSFANLEREVRPLATWEGKPLIEIDIQASQPTILTGLIDVDDSYVELLQEGDVYEWLQGEVLATMGTEISRDEAKTHTGMDGRQSWGLIPWLFSKRPNDKRYEALENVIQGSFPKLYAGIAKIRMEGNLACRLQRLESQLVIDEVAVPLLKANPGHCVLTVHDALCMDESEMGRNAMVGLTEAAKRRGVKGFKAVQRDCLPPQGSA